MSQTYIIIIHKLPVTVAWVLLLIYRQAFFFSSSPGLFGLMDVECINIFLLPSTCLHFVTSTFYVNNGGLNSIFKKIKTSYLTGWSNTILFNYLVLGALFNLMFLFLKHNWRSIFFLSVHTCRHTNPNDRGHNGLSSEAETCRVSECGGKWGKVYCVVK